MLAIVVALHAVIVEVLCPLLILVTYTYSPRGYAIDDGANVIKRSIENIRIPLADVPRRRGNAD